LSRRDVPRIYQWPDEIRPLIEAESLKVRFPTLSC